MGAWSYHHRQSVARDAQGWTLQEQTPNERSQGEMVRRDYGVKSKPRLSGGTLSAWTSRPGVSWMETVVTQSGQYRSGGSQHVLS